MALDVVEETGQRAGTVAGFTAHGSAEPRGQSAVPLSVLFEGRFGRMFRDPSIKIVEHTDNALIHLGKTMREPAGAGAEEDNQNLPAAYTYLGQFVDHDITFDPTSLQQQGQRPGRAHRLPHAPLRPGLAVRSRLRRQPVPVRVDRPALPRHQAPCGRVGEAPIGQPGDITLGDLLHFATR